MPKTSGGYSRAILLAVALLLPAASLIPLGSLWLWEHGYVIHWAVGTCLAVTGVYYLQRRLTGAAGGCTRKRRRRSRAALPGRRGRCRPGTTSSAWPPISTRSA